MLSTNNITINIKTKIFEIITHRYTSGFDEGVGGMINEIRNLIPNTVYYLKIDIDNHVQLSINSTYYIKMHGNNSPNHSHSEYDIYYDDQSKTWKYGILNTYYFHIQSDSNGKITVATHLCSAHPYAKSKYTLTWEKYNVSQETDWISVR